MTGSLAAFTASVIVPLLEQAQPRLVLLVSGGFGAGDDTAFLLAVVEATRPHGGAVHVANPAPAFDVDAVRQSGGDRFVLHRAPGRDVVGLLPTPDILLLDPDPNYFTVHGMLHAALAQATRQGRPFPLTLLGNCAWPYGRRDGYTDPALIPAAHRHPHQTAGLLPGHPAPCPGGGLFADRIHAEAEHHPGTGVLTAAEAFALSLAPAMAITTMPMLHGLGLLYPRTAAATPALQPLLEGLAMGPAARMLAEATELGRLALAAENADLKRAQEAAQYRNDALHQALRDEQIAAAALRRRPPLAAPQPAPHVQDAAENDAPRRPRRLRRAAQLLAWTVKGQVTQRRMQERQQGADAERLSADIARLRASPILDADWYLDRYEDVAASGQDPALHYLRDGAAEGRDPGPAFSTAFYLSHSPDVAEAGINPLLHYLASGSAEGRNPNPLFDSRFYLETNADVAGAGQNPLEHYLLAGRAEGRHALP